MIRANAQLIARPRSPLANLHRRRRGRRRPILRPHQPGRLRANLRGTLPGGLRAILRTSQQEILRKHRLYNLQDALRALQTT